MDNETQIYSFSYDTRIDCEDGNENCLQNLDVQQFPDPVIIIPAAISPNTGFDNPDYQTRTSINLNYQIHPQNSDSQIQTPISLDYQTHTPENSDSQIHVPINLDYQPHTPQNSDSQIYSLKDSDFETHTPPPNNLPHSSNSYQNYQNIPQEKQRRISKRKCKDSDRSKRNDKIPRCHLDGKRSCPLSDESRSNEQQYSNTQSDEQQLKVDEQQSSTSKYNEQQSSTAIVTTKASISEEVNQDVLRGSKDVITTNDSARLIDKFIINIMKNKSVRTVAVNVVNGTNILDDKFLEAFIDNLLVFNSIQKGIRKFIFTTLFSNESFRKEVCKIIKHDTSTLNILFDIIY